MSRSASGLQRPVAMMTVLPVLIASLAVGIFVATLSLGRP
jgi:flagellar biosynthesis protein FliQ